MKTDNEIIAEFMGGWNDSNHTKSIGMNVPQDGNPHWEDQWYDYKDMKYAISWDWLMPVVEKTHRLCDSKEKEFPEEKDLDDPTGWRAWSYRRVKLSTDINYVREQTLEFISFYNQHNQ